MNTIFKMNKWAEKLVNCSGSVNTLILFCILILSTACGGGGDSGNNGNSDIGDGDPITVDEGSISSPKDITNLIPYTGTVPDSGTYGYYLISGLTAGQDYYVSFLQPTNWFDLLLYSDLYSTSISCNILDKTQEVGGGPEGCIFTAPGDKVYIEVNSTYAFSGGSFTIYSGVPFVSEGSSNTPIDITQSLPYYGQVDTFTQSYYVVTGLKQDTVYAANFIDPLDTVRTNVHISGYNPGTAYGCQSAQQGTLDRVCYITLGTYFPTYDVVFEVFGSSSVVGTDFSIPALTEIGPAIYSEGGSTNPMDISVQLPTYSGSVNNHNQSYYLITGLNPKQGYTVEMIDLSAEAGFRLFETANYYEGADTCRTNLLDAVDKICSSTTDEFGYLWIWVNGQFSNYGTYFTLNVSSYSVPALSATFVSDHVPRMIPGVGSVESELNISGAATSISQITLEVTIAHTQIGELTLTLTSPSGTSVVLSANNGGAGDDMVNTIFDDTASVSIVNGTAPLTGQYLPENPLTTFNGENANGMWTLTVDDSTYGTEFSDGSIQSWGLTVN
jgi:subtilisin-like proprotein convertase family protein